jgi:hypothetical protein
MSDDIIVHVRKINWQELEVRFADGGTASVPRTAKLAKRMEGRDAQFFYARVVDGEIRLGKFAPWQGMNFGQAMTA